MIRKYNFPITILLSGLICFSLFPYKSAFLLQSPIEAFAEKSDSNSTVKDTTNLVLDNETYEVLPDHFRKSSDIQTISNNEKINTEGLKSLNISGSQQFSKMNLPLLLNVINTDLPIIDFDLRQESHGFVNGIPISFENEHNNANEDLTDKQILQKEKEQLDSIKIGTPLTFYNKPKLTIAPKEVIDENTLVTSNGIKYIRIFATDEILPAPSVIDSFVDAVNKIDKESWLHFHCKEGIGRTTTFMIFYDMMKNYKDVSADDIIARQIELGDFNENDLKLLTSERRIESYNNFYNYLKDNDGNFNIKYSDYIKSKE